MPGLDMNQRPDDQEAAMARADLYKLANYSFKLFKMIRDGDQLEGWVQAKVTKAADYIASVYHYLEYEMKFSEYGSKLENSDVYSEAVQKMYARKLTEAKVMLDKMKERAMQAEGWEDMMAANKKQSDDEKKSKGTGKFDVKKTSTGTQYTRKSGTFDDGGKDSDHKKAEKKNKGVKEGSIQGGVWTADAPKKGAPNVPVPSPDEGPSTAKKPAAPVKKPVAGAKPAVAPVKEGKKPDFLDMDKDGDKKETMKKAVADKKAGPQKGVNPFAKKTNEALKGGQTKLDVDKDGKLEKSDFAKLRAKKTTETAAKCNHTGKGEKCPVHGLKECGMYEFTQPKDLPKKGDKIGKEGNAFGKAVRDAKAAGAKTMTVAGKEMPVRERDEGKHNNATTGFKALAKKAGGGEKGKRIAGAVLSKLRK